MKKTYLRKKLPPIMYAGLWVMVIYCGFFPHAWAHRKHYLQIDEIVIVGAKHTRPHIIIQELTFREGEHISYEQIQQSRQAILNLALFNKVELEIDGKVLRIHIKEKKYFLALPEVRHKQETGISVGGYVNFDNLLGLNQYLKIRYRSIEAAQSKSGVSQTLSAQYIYPRIGGSLYNLDTNFNIATEPVDLQPTTSPLMTYNRRDYLVKLLASKWINKNRVSKGWRVGGGALTNWRTNSLNATYQSQVPEGRISALIIQNTYTDINNLIYSVSGYEYNINLELGAQLLSSDYDYYKITFQYDLFYPLSKPHQNFNVEFNLATASRKIFDAYNYSLGGFDGLRGYDNGEVYGNITHLTRFEYLSPVFNSIKWRSVTFFDIGNAFERSGKLDIFDLRYSVGLGLRFKINFFVDMEMRFDVAHNLTNDKPQIYATIRKIREK